MASSASASSASSGAVAVAAKLDGLEWARPPPVRYVDPTMVARETGYQFAFERVLEDNFADTERVLADRPKPCENFREGRCRMGGRCPFRHERVVCKHWLRDLCKKDKRCDYLHEYDLSKMPECHFWREYGECSNPDCDYLHRDPEERMKDCEFYQQGFCQLGPACQSRHVRKLACDKYLAGFCPEGPNCPYGHPKHDKIRSYMSRDHRNSVCESCGLCHRPGHFASECPGALKRPRTSDSSRPPSGRPSSSPSGRPTSSSSTSAPQGPGTQAPQGQRGGMPPNFPPPQHMQGQGQQRPFHAQHRGPPPQWGQHQGPPRQPFHGGPPHGGPPHGGPGLLGSAPQGAFQGGPGQGPPRYPHPMQPWQG